MQTIEEVNPATVRKGDRIIRNGKPSPVKSVSFCESGTSHVHIDHECYDTRFSTVKRVK